MGAEITLEYKVPSMFNPSGSRGRAEKAGTRCRPVRACPLSMLNKRIPSKSGASISGQKNILGPIFCPCTTVGMLSHWGKDRARKLHNGAGRGWAARRETHKARKQGGRGYSDGMNKAYSWTRFLPIDRTQEMMHGRGGKSSDMTIWRSP